MTPNAREFLDRLEALDAALEELDVGAVVVTHAPSVRYLTGFSGSSGFVFHAVSGPTVLITDFRYEEQAGGQIPAHVTLHISKEGWIGALADVCADTAAGRAAFEPEHMTVLEHGRLRERLDRLEFVAAKQLVTGLRAVKSADEIESIAAAAVVAETALTGLLATVEWGSGPTEVDIASALERELRAAGSEGLPFDVIVAGGERTSLPHATPSSRPVQPGDFVMVDFGAIVDGYCSDITRTFVIGSPAEWQLEVHSRVREAQAAAIEAIGTGVSGVAVDQAARDHLAEHDLARFFGHSTGHGIGLEVHEEPRLSAKSEDVLEPGNVVTVEPGVYLPGRGGVRIEDDVLVTESGSRVLTSVSRDLVQL